MLHFFSNAQDTVFAVDTRIDIDQETIDKLSWLFGNATLITEDKLTDTYIGPRAAMITPWSTNAVEICQNMSIDGIVRIEQYHPSNGDDFDPMLSQSYQGLTQDLFIIDIEPEEIQHIEDIQAYNEEEGLALSAEEVAYLENLSERLGRKLTDSEVFGFSQVNSEHCRHKIFNGTFIIDGEEKPQSLFKLIKKTSAEHPNGIVSAYKDNVAFVKGPKATQFAPERPDVPSDYQEKTFDSVLSLKAETHNFPTTVEPFNGAATGSGGEIRDRLAGGQGSLPLAGTAVYMTSYSRLNNERPWEKTFPERQWLYQSPMDILIKASNGASDFGNKFGQPLIAGSVLTFEHKEEAMMFGYDKVIMLAGGIGYGKAEQALKQTPTKDDKIVILGGDNYRIGMGGAAVSSTDTGEFESGIELNAVQRSNPEMQKRVANTIRGMVENDSNPIISIHDHGAGGHLNCLSELVEETGGKINLDALPVGDPTLSNKEIIGNESQERMGLVIGKKDIDLLQKIAERERSPFFEVGDVTDDHRFTFTSNKTGESPMDLELADMFGSSPKTIMDDKRVIRTFASLDYDDRHVTQYIKNVLRLESVACKDWLTNKVDRCVGGKVATQQTVGPLQLPLNNVAVMAMDYNDNNGVATSIGHASIGGLIDAASGARNAIAECLTNLVFAPLDGGLASVSLSANWMWPCKNEGEDARLYDAVEAVSDFAVALGINIPTGKDSLSMAQKYDDKTVLAPGTVIISSVAPCADITSTIEPLIQSDQGKLYFVDFSKTARALGGSAFAQSMSKIGNSVPDVGDAGYFALVFDTIQEAIKKGMIVAGHDISSGGLITTLLEMCFANNNLGLDLDLTKIEEGGDFIKTLFAENSGIVVQAKDSTLLELLSDKGVAALELGSANTSGIVSVKHKDNVVDIDVAEYRDIWYETSYLLDNKQTSNDLAKERYANYKNQPLNYTFPSGFDGKLPQISDNNRPQAAIIREKGSNSERELANSLYKAGFKVRDVHMTDLISGRETLEDVQFLGAVGGFSNSDVLGSAKGWAGAFKYNEKARTALENFFSREDTLSIGICNGCQLFLELDLINPEHEKLAKMKHNRSMKHECQFTSMTIPANNSVMFSSLEGSTLGVWISHGEGRFDLPMSENDYHIVGTYGYDAYPANPNNSDYNVAAIASPDGRHLATMPHIERSLFSWNWAYYPKNRSKDAVSPWMQAFVNAREWCLSKK